HKAAFEKAGILHRDLSFHNTVLIGDGDDERGILIDWDLSRSLTSVDTGDARVRGRTGTWQFISHALLQHPTKKHSIEDDLESSFWTLLWTLLHYVPSNLQTIELVHVMGRVFDECSWNFPCGYYEGGTAKQLVFTNGFKGTTDYYLSFPHAPPLDQLIQSLADLFEPWVYYSAQLLRNEEKALAKARNNATGPSTTLSNVLKSDHVIKLFDDALASPGWPARDVVENLIGKIPRHAPHSNSKPKRSSDFEGVSTAKIQRRSGTADAGSSLRLQT
ncbi:hypothetical protein NEOLEDRAFT_1077449, partial [Neolentinus lepideus HHB14362 ss-1]